MSDEPVQYCSFCGKARAEVKHLIAGPTVFICDECIDLCHSIIEREGKTPPEPEDEPIAFLVRAPRGTLEGWCRELVGAHYRADTREPRWMVLPIEGQDHRLAAGEIATWKVVIPGSFGSLLKLSWPQATEAAV